MNKRRFKKSAQIVLSSCLSSAILVGSSAAIEIKNPIDSEWFKHKGKYVGYAVAGTVLIVGGSCGIYKLINPTSNDGAPNSTDGNNQKTPNNETPPASKDENNQQTPLNGIGGNNQQTSGDETLAAGTGGVNNQMPDWKRKEQQRQSEVNRLNQQNNAAKKNILEDRLKEFKTNVFVKQCTAGKRLRCMYGEVDSKDKTYGDYRDLWQNTLSKMWDILKLVASINSSDKSAEIQNAHAQYRGLYRQWGTGRFNPFAKMGKDSLKYIWDTVEDKDKMSETAQYIKDNPDVVKAMFTKDMADKFAEDKDSKRFKDLKKYMNSKVACYSDENDGNKEKVNTKNVEKFFELASKLALKVYAPDYVEKQRAE